MNMEKICKLLKKELNKNQDKQLVIWCIGTKNVVGDSLGPYVGERLIKSNINKKILIKGNLEKPIHYLNIEKEIEVLNKNYSNIYSIVIDSSLYMKSYIGKIVIVKNETVLGKALNKSRYIIGNLGIMGIVGEDYKDPIKNFKILESVPEKFIKKMSLKIASQILELIN